MREYDKIQTVYKRDPETNHKTLLEGEFSLPEFKYLRDNEWIFTEKVDGTNIRVIWVDEKSIHHGTSTSGGDVEFRGRTDNAQLPPHLLKALQGHFTGERLEASLTGPCALYGEGYGVKIQKGGGDYRADAGFILFDVWCGMWLEQSSVREIGAALDIPVVPVIGSGTLIQAIETVKAKAFGSLLRKTLPEGLVMRPAVELLDRRGNRIITKIKLKDFPGEAK